MSSMNKKIMLQSSDGKSFEVEEAVAVQSQTIRHMIEVDCASGTIPLPNVTGDILAKVLEYCKKHVGPASDDDDDSLKGWDAEFVKLDDELDTLHGLIMAANYLDIKSLLDLTCQKVADMLTGLTPEQMRKKLNIENDLTREEVEQVREENQWAFDY